MRTKQVLRDLTTFWALLLVWHGRVVTAQGANASQGLVLQAHGSGDDAVGTEIDKMINLLESRTKPLVYLTMRGCGTAAAQTEFMGPPDAPAMRSYNDFGVGGVPLNSTQYGALTQAGATPLQLPFVLAKVSVFSTVPASALGGAELYLSPCTLAKIYTGQITVWDDPAITTDNPGIVVPPSTPLRVFRIAGPSGATRALTAYLHTACSSVWTLGPTPNLDGLVPSSITAISLTKMLLSALTISQAASQPSGAWSWGVGYAVSHTAIRAGLVEVQIQNMAGTRLNSSMADNSQLAASLTTGGYPAIDGDWSASSLATKAASSSWPMILVPHLYVRQNVSFLGPSGGLLRAFLQMLLSDDAQTVFTDVGLVPLGSSMRQDLRSQMETKLVLSSSAPVFQWEDTIQPVTGQADYVVSALRTRFETVELWGDEVFLASQLAALQTRMTDILQNLSIAQQVRDELRQATQTNAQNAAMLTKVQEIAVAGVVLAVVIAVVALIIGAVYVSKTKAVDAKYSRIITDWMPGRYEQVGSGQVARSGFASSAF